MEAITAIPRAGNAGMMGFFAKQCVQNGWVCLAYDPNIGRSNHDGDLYAACEKLNAVWPRFRTWTFAVGGFSGGAKACFWPCAYLLKNEHKVAGVFFAGCNENRSQEGREAKKTPKSATNAQSLNCDHFIAALKWFAEP